MARGVTNYKIQNYSNLSNNLLTGLIYVCKSLVCFLNFYNNNRLAYLGNRNFFNSNLVITNLLSYWLSYNYTYNPTEIWCVWFYSQKIVEFI